MSRFTWPLHCLLLALMLSRGPTGASAAADSSSPADVTVSLPEGSPAGTLVVNLASRLQAGQEDIKLFAMVNEQMDGQLVSLDRRTGLVTARRQVDRATVARITGRPCDSRCELSILVHVEFQRVPAQLITLRVQLLAQNNHEPEFRVVNRQVEISELAEVNRTSLGLPFQVLDRDSPRFGLRQLWLATPSDAAPDDPAVSVFDVEPRHLTARDAAEPVRVSLLLRSPLDRETRSSYRLVLVATDAGDPPKTGCLTFTVNVRDENDNQPVWITTEREFNISEAAPGGYLVTQLQAKDADDGQNGRIVYRFNEAQTDSLALQSFDLDATTGQLRVGRGARLDYERNRIFRLPVIARDQGYPPKQAETRVTVRLLDENDETPSIQANGIAPAGGPVSANPPLTVSENRRAGELIGYVMATDRDSGENSRVSCRLAEGNRLALHLQQSQDTISVYKLVTLVELDREQDLQVTDTVVCSDAGRPSRTASQQLRVTVLDENDSPPEFEQPSYTMEFDEEQEPGSHIGRVAARDPDQAGRLTYSLDPDGDRLVSIGESNGVIRSRQRFDRESRDQYRFQVRVTDGAHWANASVELVIRDINDHQPEWIGQEDLSVTENSPAGTFVGRVKAVDADVGDNGRVSYAIRPPNLNFDIRPDGSVYTRTNRLDRELTPVLEINVTARDWGRPRHQSRWRTFHVRLLDVNDNTPSFVFPAGANNRVNVSCRESPNTVVATLSATDPDEAENGSVSYNMTEDGWSAGFGLDPRLGHLLLVRSLECRQASLALKVTASDAGKPPRSSMRVLLVTVSDWPPDVGVGDGVDGRGFGGSGVVGGVSRANAGGVAGGGGGRHGGVGGNSGGGRSRSDLDQEATSLTAIVGLMIATGVLIVVLVFAVCLLKRKAHLTAAGAVTSSRASVLDKRRGPGAAGMSGKDISLPQQIGVDRTLLSKSSAAQRQQLQAAQAFALADTRRRQSFEATPPPGYYNYPDGSKRPHQQQPQLHQSELQLLFGTQSRGSSARFQQPPPSAAPPAASSYQTILRPAFRQADPVTTPVGCNYSQLLLGHGGPNPAGGPAEDGGGPSDDVDDDEDDIDESAAGVGTPKSARKSSAAPVSTAGTVGKKLRTPYTTVSFV